MSEYQIQIVVAAGGPAGLAAAVAVLVFNLNSDDRPDRLITVTFRKEEALGLFKDLFIKSSYIAQVGGIVAP